LTNILPLIVSVYLSLKFFWWAP